MAMSAVSEPERNPEEVTHSARMTSRMIVDIVSAGTAPGLSSVYGVRAQDPLDRCPEVLSCDRLGQPGVCRGPLGEELVGSPIEQQDEGDVGEMRLVFGLPNRPGDRHATHAADLHVDDDDVRPELDDLVDGSAGIGHLVHFGSGIAESGGYLVSHPGSIRDEQDL